MSEVKPELKQCSRCHSICTFEHYEKNRKGEWFKLCNNCRSTKREERKEYRDTHREEVLQQKRDYRRYNQGKIRQANRQYREQHREEIALKQKEYREKQKQSPLAET